MRANQPASQNASERLSNLRNMDADILCKSAKSALQDLANIMNQETTLLRNGHYLEASQLSEQKATIAQEYVGLARVIQHQSDRLHTQAPTHLRALQNEHEKLATQMAENLRVLATAKTVTQSILSDVAASVAKADRPNTYAPSGQVSTQKKPGGAGLSLNKSL
ncbi:MAG TPA: hypothetical protein ENK61_02550 [Devosia sp.]|nr:hypothetical protein [Devosia sp.]